MTTTEGLQSEITAKKTSTATIEMELIRLGENNQTGNVTSKRDTYSFDGAKPSEIAYLSGL